MTNEEAIEIFKRLKENAPNEMHLETVGTAQELFSMAISALEQEPCDDAISREDAREAFSKWFFDRKDLRTVDEVVDKLPPVTQKGDVKNV